MPVTLGCVQFPGMLQSRFVPAHLYALTNRILSVKPPESTILLHCTMQIYNLNGSIIEGLFVALSGFACSVAASGAIFELVFCVYEKYESLQIFAVVKHFIRPIISGLLLTVAVSLYTSGICGQIQEAAGGNSSIVAFVITFLVIIANLVLMIMQRRGKNIHLIWKIVISAGISSIGCNLLF